MFLAGLVDIGRPNGADRVKRLIPPPFRGFLRPYSGLVLLGSIPVIILAVVAYLVSSRAVETLVHRGNDAAALITAAMVEREFEHWAATLASHAGFPTLASGVASGDVDVVRRRLGVFVSAHERLDRAFVTDTTGLLWTDFPEAPESLDRRFDDRDWFEGVRRTDRPYVSEVYRRHAQPAILVVSVAAPVRSPTSGELAGYLVAQVRLDGLSRLLARVEVGEDGIVLLKDHSGALVAHPHLDVRDRRHDEYAGVLGVDDVDGEPTRARYDDPLAGDPMLASAVSVAVGDHDWVVISQQPVAAALGPTRALALRLAGAGALMVALLGILLWSVAREYARRRRAEEDLKILNEELEKRVEERTAALREREEQLHQAQKMEAVGRLAGGLAHDFNNLLTVVLGCTELVLEGLPDEAPQRRELEEVQRAADRASSLTNQLLAFGRKQVLQPRVIDVNECVERIRSILERTLGEDVGLTWRLRPDLHPVKFDPSQIEQVLMNLAVNARDAMPRGGKLTIETANVELDEDYVEEHVDARPGSHVMLAVSDTGVGMDAETRQRIFEPFFTTKRLGQGTGLGLSTVYGIVRQGGGNIWVYSEPDQGTTFKVYLPATGEAPQPLEEQPDRRVVEQGAGTVLVVEDEDLVRKLVVRLLSAAGYDVLDAADADAAIGALRSHDGNVDLLLTDVVLPDAGGPELAARLAEDGDELAILYMSGYTDDAIVDHGILESGAAFIEKPFTAQRLLEAIQDVLGTTGQR